MNEKNIAASQTIQGIIGLFVLIIGLLGVQVSQEEKNLLEVGVVGIAGVFFTARAILGRIRAKRDLKIGSRLL